MVPKAIKVQNTGGCMNPHLAELQRELHWVLRGLEIAQREGNVPYSKSELRYLRGWLMNSFSLCVIGEFVTYVQSLEQEGPLTEDALDQASTRVMARVLARQEGSSRKTFARRQDQLVHALHWTTDAALYRYQQLAWYEEASLRAVGKKLATAERKCFGQGFGLHGMRRAPCVALVAFASLR